VNTARFAAVRFRSVTPTLCVVSNAEGFRKSWNLSYISKCSSLLISAYMWNVSTWSKKYFYSHHLKLSMSPRRGQSSTACSGGSPLGSSFWLLSCSGRNTTLDLSSSLGSGYSACLLTRIGRNRNDSLSCQKIGESTQQLSGHSLYHCPEMSFQSWVSPNTHTQYASRHVWSVHAPGAPWEVYLSTRVFTWLPHPQSTHDWWGVRSPWISKRVVFH